ncbi:MAG: hypothetical protein HY554_14485 [Elusimicrobia bacterium]|nr:hypothetical protein [Elusimicrobiota bacterium]
MTNLRGEVLAINAPAMATLGVRLEDATQADKGRFELVRQDQLRGAVRHILEKRTRSEVEELSRTAQRDPRSGSS